MQWHCGPQNGWLMRTSPGHVDPSARDNQGSSILPPLSQVGRTWQVSYSARQLPINKRAKNQNTLKISVEQGLVLFLTVTLSNLKSPAESLVWERQSIDTDGFLTCVLKGSLSGGFPSLEVSNTRGQPYAEKSTWPHCFLSCFPISFSLFIDTSNWFVHTTCQIQASIPSNLLDKPSHNWISV